MSAVALTRKESGPDSANVSALQVAGRLPIAAALWLAHPRISFWYVIANSNGDERIRKCRAVKAAVVAASAA